MFVVLIMQKLPDKYRIAVFTLGIFIFIGILAWLFRDFRYFLLFFGIGLGDAIARLLVELYPRLRQTIRVSLQVLVGGSLLTGLSLIVGVNFQFIEVVFDAVAFIVTGALIQLIVARIILPFFVGNAFCSRACWSGAFFELTNSKKQCKRKPKKRSEWLAWTYLLFIIALGLYIAFFRKSNPAEDFDVRRWWIIGENLLIMAAGFFLTFLWGSRAYCRLFCPFITISGVIAPISFLKITPVNPDNCTKCNACTRACPMLIPVMDYVEDHKRVNDKMCILCERCISACKEDVLKDVIILPLNNKR